VAFSPEGSVPVVGDFEDQVQGEALARVGGMIGEKYRLERLIGAGGMACVYEATHRNANRVAIKVLHPFLSVHGELRTRFLREGYAANTVDHRGAVRVLDDDIAEDGSVFLVMELLDGETLDARCKREGGRLPDGDVCEYARQLLDVLAAAHAKGIVHRDIKPENLFLTTEGTLKVLDFGIARLRETSGSAAVTKTGRMMGTPAFMPPEQALGRSKDIDGRSDLYAAGATMFTLMTGCYVHEAETAEEMYIRAGSCQARSVRAVAPRLPAEVAGVIDRALAFQMAERWESARAMDAALAQACQIAYGARASGASEGPRARPVPPTVDDRSSAPARLSPAAPTLPSGTTGSGPRSATLGSAPPAMDHATSTTAGVASSPQSSDERPAGVPVPLGIRRAAVWGGLGVALMAGIGGLYGVTRGRDPVRSNSAQGIPTTATPPISHSLAVPTPSAALAPQPLGTAQELALRPDAGPEPTHVAPSSVRPPPVHVPPPTTAAAETAQPPPPPAVTKPATHVNCEIPYRILPDGTKELKPECL
jgi:serine/threonine-protein kinase